MEIRLDGRSAVITGGSKGLGLAIATEYARSGADVAILARDPGTLAEAKAKIEAGAPGRRVAAISCDVSKADAIRRAYDQIMSQFGKIDIYVNNAGQSTRGPSETLTDEVWQADLDLKLFAQIRFCRLVFPQMKERRWGRIISVLNIGAKAPGADSAPTSVTRAAQMAFTKVLSQEGAPYNVLVNSLHVGVIVSDQIRRRYDRERPNLSFEQYVAEAGKGVPLGRMGRAEEFANVATFLASDAANPLPSPRGGSGAKNFKVRSADTCLRAPATGRCRPPPRAPQRWRARSRCGAYRRPPSGPPAPAARRGSQRAASARDRCRGESPSPRVRAPAPSASCRPRTH